MLFFIYPGADSLFDSYLHVPFFHTKASGDFGPEFLVEFIIYYEVKPCHGLSFICLYVYEPIYFLCLSA